MSDLLNATRGKNHCPWCEDRGESWFEKLFEHPRWGKAAWGVQRVTYRIGLWKLGAKWHRHFHYVKTDKDYWIENVKVGDIVCDCRGLHVPIIKIGKDGDSVVTEGDHACSLWSCCGPVMADNGCHEPGEVTDDLQV